MSEHPQELISLPSYGHSRLYQRAALCVAAIAVAIVATTAIADDAGAAKQQGPHVFPVPAKHTYGDGFGAGRGHQGQDVFANCGRKIRAARGGKVQVSGSQSGAGNYAVIDGQGTDWDYVYMHMQKRPPKEGTRIGTGEVLGRVGESGNASGCHLHFEMWSPPGYYEGGEAKRSVTKHLKSWDKYS